MARPAGRRAVLAQAKEVLETARSVDELKMAQAVILPLELGLTLRQTAAAIGVSPGWVCRLRRRFERIVQSAEKGSDTIILLPRPARPFRCSAPLPQRFDLFPEPPVTQPPTLFRQIVAGEGCLA